MADPTKRAPIEQIPACQEWQKRRDWDRHRELVRASSRAKRRAVKELVKRYPAEYDLYLAHFAAQEGVTPKGRRGAEAEAAQLRTEIARLQQQLAGMQEQEAS